MYVFKPLRLLVIHGGMHTRKALRWCLAYGGLAYPAMRTNRRRTQASAEGIVDRGAAARSRALSSSTRPRTALDLCRLVRFRGWCYDSTLKSISLLRSACPIPLYLSCFVCPRLEVHHHPFIGRFQLLTQEAPTSPSGPARASTESTRPTHTHFTLRVFPHASQLASVDATPMPHIPCPRPARSA